MNSDVASATNAVSVGEVQSGEAHCTGSKRRSPLRSSMAWLLVALSSTWCSISTAQVSVSSNGQPSYTIPVDVPPGIAGVSPKLSIVYTGSTVNGPVGIGWTLQGISMITRCPSTISTDASGRTAGVMHSPSDKLCLDGQRLIQSDAMGTSQPFPQANDALGLAAGFREFRTEKDIFARVRAYGIAGGNANNGPAYFRVWTKSGLIYDYGAAPSADANSRALVAAHSTGVGMVWLVSRISDTAGNFMDFKYDVASRAWGTGPTASPTEGHEWNIAEIQYTGRSGQAAANKVLFIYDTRSDGAETFSRGSKSVSTRLLREIRTVVNSANPGALGATANSVRSKTYKLVYGAGPSTNRSRLTSVVECAGASASKCLPPSTFEYSNGLSDVFEPSVSFRSSALYRLPMTNSDGTLGILLGDFNGDGRTDILRWSDTVTDNQLHLSAGNGSFTRVPNGTAARQFNITNDYLTKGDGCFFGVVADFNGDGADDILRVRNPTAAAGAACPVADQYLYLSRGDGSFNAVTVTGPTLERRSSKPRTDCLRADPKTGFCYEPGDKSGWTVGNTFYVLDVNGDGILDLVTAMVPGQSPVTSPPTFEAVCASFVCTRIWYGALDGTFREVPAAETNVTNRVFYAPPPLAKFLGAPVPTVDIDGDGSTDIVGGAISFFGAGLAWRSRGNGFFDRIDSTAGCVLPIDLNGDGSIDCVVPGLHAAAPNRFTLSRGTGTSSDIFSNLVDGSNELQRMDNLTRQTVGIVVADINNDGRHDMLRWRDSGAASLFISNGNGSFTQSSTFSLGALTSLPLKTVDWSRDFALGDFTGRGSVEILALKANPTGLSDGDSNALLLRSAVTPPDLLTAVRTPTGIRTSIAYVPTTDSGGRYTSDRGTIEAATYPRADSISPQYVVRTLVTDSGVGSSTVTTEFSYAGLKFDRLGRGSLGMRKMQRQAPGPNGDPLTVTTTFRQQHPYIGVASRSETRRGLHTNPSATLISRTVNTYCDRTASAGAEANASEASPCPTVSRIQRPYLLRSVESAWDLNGTTAMPTVTTANTYNDFGDPRIITVTTTGTVAGISETYTKTTTNTYDPPNTSGDNWITGRLTRATVRNQVPNSIDAITASAGNATNATATSGVRTPLVVTLSSRNIGSSQPGAGTLSATVTATVSGNPTLPVRFQWQAVSGSGISASPADSVVNAFSHSTALSAVLGFGQSASGQWRFTATDAAGRTVSDTIDVSFVVTSNPLVITSSTPISASAGRNNPGPISATASVAASGGATPLTYSWSPSTANGITVSNGTSQTATFSANVDWAANLIGDFEVTVRDSQGQVRSAPVRVQFTSVPQPTVASIDPAILTISSATNGSVVSGSATATGTGGVPPYSFSWSGPANARIGLNSTTIASPTFSTVVSFGDDFSEVFEVRIADQAGNVSPPRSMTITARGPSSPPASPSLSPVDYGFGTVPMDATRTVAVTVTNNGGPGAFSASIQEIDNPQGNYSVNNGTCPPNGGSLAAFSSCTVNVSYRSPGQCGGTLVRRTAALTVALGGISAQATFGATNQVYSWTSPQCR